VHRFIFFGRSQRSTNFPRTGRVRAAKSKTTAPPLARTKPPRMEKPGDGLPPSSSHPTPAHSTHRCARYRQKLPAGRAVGSASQRRADRASLSNGKPIPAGARDRFCRRALACARVRPPLMPRRLVSGFPPRPLPVSSHTTRTTWSRSTGA
jgi:hypothetical protein